VPLDQPLPVVAPAELALGLGQPGGGGEVPDPEQVLLEGSNQSFGDAMALRLPHETRGAGHPQEGQLLLEIIADVGAAVVVADGQLSAGDQNRVDDPIRELFAITGS
jgi:hypothetical protein